MAVTATRTFAVSSTRSVLEATEELRTALQRPGSPEHALRRLETAARRSIDGLDQLDARGYDQPAAAAGGGRQSQPPVDDVLAVALSQLSVAAALTAAEQATGAQAAPSAPAPGEALSGSAILDDAVRGLRTATSTLMAPLRPEARQAYDVTPTAALDLPTSIEACRGQVVSTLDLLSEKAAAVATDSFKTARKLAPEHIRDAFDSYGKRLSLGSHGRRLARLAVRALDRALGALTRLIDADALLRARERVHDLWQRLERGEAMPAVMAALFDVAGARQKADALLDDDHLVAARVQTATSALSGLSARFAEHAALASAVVTGIGVVTAGVGLLNLAIPHLAAGAVAAVLLIVATVALLGMDFADAGGGLDRVPGVRRLLEQMRA